MLGKVLKFCKKSILSIIDSIFPVNEENLELDAFERELEANTQQLERLLKKCGLPASASRNMALRILLHDPEFNISDRKYANIKYVLKAKAREAGGCQQIEEKDYSHQPAYAYSSPYSIWQLLY